MTASETTVFTERDQFGLVKVVDNITTRKLFFDSEVEQSCIYLNAPMTLNFEYQQKIVQLLLDFVGNNKSTIRVLMLGMGGGSIAHHLYHTIPDLQMCVVELRQLVIDCAYNYFQLPDVPEIDVVEADAIEYVADNSYPYDIIIVDIFDDHGLPSDLGKASFQENLWKNTTDNGQIVFNLWHQWNDSPVKAKLKPTEESQQVVDYWRFFSNENPRCQLNSYNIHSSQNLILEVTKC